MPVRLSHSELDYTITLTSPPLNVLDIEMLEELHEALSSVVDDRHLLVIEAEGRVFSAGASVHDHVPERVAAMLGVFHRCFRVLERLSMPTVALVHGDALGGGFELAMACDFVLAADDARFATPEIALGVFAPVASWQLSRLAAPRRGLELLLTGDSIDAETASGLGLVNAVFPAASFRSDAAAWLARLHTKSASSLRFAKRAFRAGAEDTLSSRLGEIERLYLEELMRTEDAVEGIRAFIEKRRPEWGHR